MRNMFKKLGAVVALGAFSVSSAIASTTTGTGAVAQSAFDGFRDTVVGWARGPLGTGLAVTMMIMGAAMGVARNSPTPALSGVAGAAFLNWGPGIIETITSGALI